MPSKIISFGFRHGKPRGEDLPDGTLFTVTDVRQWIKKNPFHDRKLRQLRGTDKAVQEDILKTPGFDFSYAKLKTEVVRAFDYPNKVAIPKNNNHDVVVYIGCTGGHHRSVYIAERLGQELNIPVEHRDYHKK